MGVRTVWAVRVARIPRDWQDIQVGNWRTQLAESLDQHHFRIHSGQHNLEMPGRAVEN